MGAGPSNELCDSESQVGGMIMATDESTPVQETPSELLGFGTVSRPDRQVRIKRSVSAKVGDKSPPPPSSDIRLKTDIRQVGTTAHNLPLYTFRYLGEDDRYEGVMAQDVLKVMPSAVSVGENGYYRVHYDMLGIKMRRLGQD
jgi:hypothetical protein